ncbi:Pentatricopeptide repeat-containing protein, chloroplastic [Heracleum sosnowskyi]|uniref:Pentatricopeptide repeat-containing protein, chloroplastic n=1 Tax=Heracleum sosnowskyi TaxID=360622 RepID=A0AAD8IZZ5_9APIA|nr:Pentatricopeptide repeat-containing protein, chloroplastic [Heracleum sosnowskyi]
MAVIVLCSSSFCCSNFKHLQYGNFYSSRFDKGRNFECVKVLPFGLNWKKHRKKIVGKCGVSIKSLNFSEWVNGISKKKISSEEIILVLKSIQDLDEAFSVFLSVAELPKVVHTTETCNYMLELLRVRKRIDDMVVVFELMQKQIIYRSLNTCMIIFSVLDVKGGIRQSPYALKRMRDVGFVLNGYSYNGLIHLILQSGFCREALEVYERVLSEGIIPSLKTYSALMVASGKRRDIETVMNLLAEMESLGLRPNVYTFTICIRVLGRAGKIDEAYRILKRMDQEGCGPDVVT